MSSDIPKRLDRLPWLRWHTRIVIALGITWVLDGLEVTLGGAVAGVLRQPDTLALTDAEIGLAATFYLIGAVIGALGFGYLTDRLGRKKLFSVTLGVYLVATAASPTAAPKTKESSRGRLSFMTTPWTHVDLDGKPLGDTPLIDVPLPAGNVTLHVVNKEKNVDTDVDVEIQAGKATTKKIKL